MPSPLTKQNDNRGNKNALFCCTDLKVILNLFNTFSMQDIQCCYTCFDTSIYLLRTHYCIGTPTQKLTRKCYYNLNAFGFEKHVE